MMKRLISSGFLLLVIACSSSSFTTPDPKPDPTPAPGGEEPGQTEGALVADGKDADTYALIKACGYNYETPDESGAHKGAPFRHIRQSYDQTLGKYVFDFYIHIDSDDDRGLANITDRQRNEIKTDGHSPASMVAQQGEALVLKWRFRLPAGMQTTTSFCHIHQIKGIDNSAGTADVGNPVITFTCRSTSAGKQQFQVIFVPPTSQGGGNQYLLKTDLSGFLGEWVSVEEHISFGEQGDYRVKVVRERDDRVLVDIPATTLSTWREGTTGMRPKWGIYRSFGASGSLKSQLRDEILQFADFSIEKVSR
ncbi:hypothetical protein [uncultured Alistipes sp.]|uniref:hypothetical protein n=1 Tax=uncultured Alistipes sp. TaxID=538949 RepID=UPI0025FD0700|nr:hypothetical protein [uncultured Alistipes sp.]